MMLKSLAGRQRKNNLSSFIPRCNGGFHSRLYLGNRPRLRYPRLSPFILYFITNPVPSIENTAQQSAAAYLEPIPLGDVHRCSQLGTDSAQQRGRRGRP